MFNPFRPKTVRQSSADELPADDQPQEAPAPQPVAPPRPAPTAPAARPVAAAPAYAPAPPRPAPAPAPAPAPVAPQQAGAAPPLSTAASTALEQLVAKLPGLLFAGLTEIESGTPVRGRTPNDLIPAAGVARYHAEVIRLERQALRQAANDGHAEALREVLVTMSDQLHLLRVVRDGEMLLSITLDPYLTSLPVARMALQMAANIIG